MVPRQLSPHWTYCVSASAQSDTPAAGGFAPFAQLIKMLLPSARSVALYDTHAELRLVLGRLSKRPDLRALLDEQRAGATLASRGTVETTSAGIPVFVSALRGAGARPLGSLVVELGGGGNSRSTPSMVVSMLRPVLDCLESKLDLERSTAAADRSAGLDLLLGAERHGLRGSQRAAGTSRPLREGAPVPDRRVARSGQESRALVELRHIVHGAAGARPHTEASAGMGEAQQSPDGRQSIGSRCGVQDSLVPASRSKWRRARARSAVSVRGCGGLRAPRRPDPRVRRPEGRRDTRERVRRPDGVAEPARSSSGALNGRWTRAQRRCSTSTSTSSRRSTKRSA